jgi:putative NADH-flavin reductase
MASGRQLNVAVIGSTGYAGSHTCIELLARGHRVTGVSRNPDKLGRHDNYIGKAVDLDEASIEDLIDALAGQDVIVKYPSLSFTSMFTLSTYGPHTGGESLPYSTSP